MNQNLVATYKKKFSKREINELLKIWQENDREFHDDEEFEAIRQILMEKPLTIPSQTPFAPREDSQPRTSWIIQDHYWYLLGIGHTIRIASSNE